MNLMADLGVKCYWPDEGTEARRGKETCSRSHSWEEVEQGSDSRGSAQRLQA